MRKYVTISLLMMFSIALSGQSIQEVKNDSIKTAISYAAQAFDMLEVQDRLISNQKAQIATLGLINDESNIQVELLTRKVATIQKVGFWRTIWIWVKKIGWTAAMLATGYMIGTTM